MKKIFPIVLMLSILLSGCGLAEQVNRVKETYVAPAVESAEMQTDKESDKLFVGRDVYTDDSELTDFIPAENISSRRSDDILTELSTSDSYGSLMPYIGAYYFNEEGLRLNKYGLVTAGGMIVLDPVLTMLERASYSSENDTTWLDIYIMGKSVPSEEGEGTKTMYAAAGKDGSWATGFDYTAIMPMELGVLCIIDEEKNAAVCYSETGALVFDTRNFASLSRLKPNSISSLAECANGLMHIYYTNGQSGFMDKNGSILNRNSDMPSYFDEIRAFSDGYAAVKLYDNWNYIDSKGYYAVYGPFEEAGDFKNGVAVVKKDGVLSVIGKDKTVIKAFPNAATVTAYENWVYVKNADGSETYYLTPSIDEISLYDKKLNLYNVGYWVVGETGVRMRTFDGAEVYFSGASAIETGSTNGLYLVTLADGKKAVMDENSRVVMLGNHSIGFVSDSETGETYIYQDSGSGTDLYTSAGVLAAEGIVLRALDEGPTGAVYGKYYGPAGGLIMCSDDYSSGLKNMQNEWVFRVKVDSGD